MSQQNVEAMRVAMEAFNRRDLDLLASEFWDQQIEWQTSREDPDAATHRGREGVRRYIDQWLDSFDGLHGDIEEYIDAGDDLCSPGCAGRDGGVAVASMPNGGWPSFIPFGTAGSSGPRSISTGPKPLKP